PRRADHRLHAAWRRGTTTRADGAERVSNNRRAESRLDVLGTRDQQTALAIHRQSEREAVDLEREFGVASRKPLLPDRVVAQIERRLRDLTAQARRDECRAELVLLAPLLSGAPHGDHRDHVRVREIPRRRAREHEAAEDDPRSSGRGDDTLRARTRALHTAASGVMELLDRRRRVAT